MTDTAVHPFTGLPFYERTVLPNGLRILSSTMPATHSVAVTLYVGAGSRYERAGEEGVSHYLEHMLFKGTKKRPTAKEIAESIDGVGGLLNGATDREYTTYYIKVARPHMELASDILSELIRSPLIEPSEIEKERQVVIEELAAVADSPAQIADLLLAGLLWPDNPLGRDVAGTAESVGGIDRDMMMNYLAEQYAPNNVVVAVAGNVTHEEVVELFDRLLGGWERGMPGAWLPATSANGTRSLVQYKKTEQAHVTIAMRGIPISHPDRHAVSFLSVILGEGMSSRLFIELREKRGLVYDVSSYASHFQDTGAFNVYTGVDPKKAPEAIKVIISELERIRDHGPTTEELTKARELSKGRMMLRMEDTRAVSGWIGVQELLLGHVRTVEDVIAEMDAVTLEDLQRVAAEMIDPRKAYMAIVGPFRSDKRFAALLPK
ncbi:MAG: pitrilysin family protein [Chloroflexota bacterium]